MLQDEGATFPNASRRRGTRRMRDRRRNVRAQSRIMRDRACKSSAQTQCSLRFERLCALGGCVAIAGGVVPGLFL